MPAAPGRQSERVRPGEGGRPAERPAGDGGRAEPARDSRRPPAEPRVVHTDPAPARGPENFTREQMRLSMQLISAFRQVEQMYMSADDFFIFHGQAKTVLFAALRKWDDNLEFEAMVEDSKRRHRADAGRQTRTSGDSSQTELQLRASHNVAKQDVDGMIRAYERTTSISDVSNPLAVFKEMGLQFRKITAGDRGNQAVVDALTDAIEKGTASLEDVRNMVVTGQVGMMIELAPVIARMLERGSSAHFLHAAVDLIRNDLCRQQAAANILSLVEQPMQHHARARYILQDQKARIQLEISASLLPETEAALEEIVELEEQLESLPVGRESGNQQSFIFASLLGNCQVALQDCRIMLFGPRLSGNTQETMQRLRALRSDPQLYKAWVDDMCQVSEPLPCNDTP